MTARTFRETVNKTNVSYLLDTYTFADLRSSRSGMTKANAEKKYSGLIKYLEKKLSGTDYVKYDYKKGRVNGRMYGENSIQNCQREVRGFLCDGLTTDLDICNAHPICLKNICEKHEIECPNLKEYCMNREECLAKIGIDDNIDRATAKKKLLIATNYNKKTLSNNSFFKNYDREMKNIQKRLQDIQEYSYLKEFAKQDDNFAGSFINHILCIAEDSILQIMIDCCEKLDMEIHSLMFDGLMVYKTSVSVESLKLMEKAINEAGWTDVFLTTKEHEYTFKIPEDYIHVIIQTYSEVRENFELTNCKVGHRFVNVTNEESLILSRTDFNVLNEELTFGREHRSFIKDWFKDKDKNKKDYFDSFPKDTLCPPNCYNLWREFPVVKMKEAVDPDIISKCKTALDWFLNHVKVLVNHNDQAYNFVCNWIAQMFQYPEHKSVELIFISKEGCGKGCFLEFFKTIMGGNTRCWEVPKPQRDLFGEFNPMMKDAFLVIMNEANKSNFFNVNDLKKTLITDSQININIKNVSSFAMRSYHRFITFSNNPAPSVPNARRDMIVRCSDEKIGKTDYFDEGWSYAVSTPACKFIYDYFMKIPVKPKINAVDIPITDYHTEMVEQHRPHIDLFLDDIVQTWNGACVTLKEIQKGRFYELYKDYCQENYITNPQEPIAFGMKLTFLGLKSITKCTKKIDGKTKGVYIFDVKLAMKELKLG